MGNLFNYFIYDKCEIKKSERSKIHGIVMNVISDNIFCGDIYEYGDLEKDKLKDLVLSLKKICEHNFIFSLILSIPKHQYEKFFNL